MRKKRVSKKRKTVKVKEEKPTLPSTQESHEEKPFDFGGLPNRDLKKNLGCG
jgi:hypothetical protein